MRRILRHDIEIDRHGDENQPGQGGGTTAGRHSAGR
jgi:hypothetical protein